MKRFLIFLNSKNKIKLATKIATKAHKNQFDKAGEEYINHPLTVASWCNTEPEKVVALLHDVVEDHAQDGYTLKFLEKYFDQDTIDAVWAITKQGNESRQEYIERVKSNKLATAVKINDLKHNMDLSRLPAVTKYDLKRNEKYNKELQKLLCCK